MTDQPQPTPEAERVAELQRQAAAARAAYKATRDTGAPTGNLTRNQRMGGT